MYMIYLNFVYHAFNALASDKSDTSVSIKTYSVSFLKIFYSKLHAAFN